MSGVAIIASLMAGSSSLTVVVPAAQIFGGTVPLSTDAPNLSTVQISGVESTNVAMAGATRLRTERVQVTIHAISYAQQKQILELVRQACKKTPGANVVNGFYLDSILPGGEGPDDGDADAALYEQTVDFLVRYRST